MLEDTNSLDGAHIFLCVFFPAFRNFFAFTYKYKQNSRRDGKIVYVASLHIDISGGKSTNGTSCFPCEKQYVE